MHVYILRFRLFRILEFQFILACIFIQTIAFVSCQERPILRDPNYRVEVVAEGLDFPTSMAFLGPDDILVLEKDNGTARRIVNGTILQEPILDIPVATMGERGLLGSAVMNNMNDQDQYVFLYYTESSGKDGDDASRESEPLGNRLYRYELEDNKLINPKLLLDLPADVPSSTIPFHNGGKVLIGPDGNVYLIMGDLESRKTQAQNTKGGPEPDGTSVIYRITQDGKSVDNNPLGTTQPVDKFYAYGIRNGFGMDFDPVTGNLWDTENGPSYGDEINLVEPGFNSGSLEVHGMSSDDDNFDLNKLVDFDGKGEYSDPEFVWQIPVGVTALRFIDSDKYGEEYENDILVGDVNNGNLYHFSLREDRTHLLLEGKLEDKTADDSEELDDVLFGEGFGGITDIEIGHDGYIYVLAINRFQENNEGTIYRIVPI